jgi:hypothetical protein
MKKFRLKKSANEEILQPIVKVVQNEENQDKHYFNKSKWGLINYLKSEAKEGKIQLYQSGDVGEENGLKHIIISPRKINAWEQMNTQERLDLRESFISKLQSDFKNKNYLLAIEEKPRLNEHNQEVMMEHYHLVLSNKTPTDKSFKVNFKKSLMTNYIEKFTTKDTREKLNIKTFNEIKEHKIDKLQKHHNKSLESMIVKDELTTLYQISKNIFKDKQDAHKFNRIQKHYLLKEKENLFKDISRISNSLKQTNSHIKFLDTTLKTFKSNKNILVKQLTKELFGYRKKTQSELNDFTLYSNKEHHFFQKLQDYKLKNGTINQEEFLTSVSRSQSYWDEERICNRRIIENNLKSQQLSLEKQILNLECEILNATENISKFQDTKNLLNIKLDMKKYLSNSKSLHLQTFEEILQNRLQVYNNYFKYVNEKIGLKKDEQQTIHQDNSANNYDTF